MLTLKCELQGRRVSFKNTLIVMTSNVGSTSISNGKRSIGFQTQTDTEEKSYAAMKSLVMEELKAFFRPELLNRIDEVVVFHPLEKTQACCFYRYCTCILPCTFVNTVSLEMLPLHNENKQNIHLVAIPFAHME